MEEALCFSWEELIVCSLRDFSIVARMIFCFESFVLLLAVVEFSWSFVRRDSLQIPSRENRAALVVESTTGYTVVHVRYMQCDDSKKLVSFFRLRKRGRLLGLFFSSIHL